MDAVPRRNLAVPEADQVEGRHREGGHRKEQLRTRIEDNEILQLHEAEGPRKSAIELQPVLEELQEVEHRLARLAQHLGQGWPVPLLQEERIQSARPGAERNEGRRAEKGLDESILRPGHEVEEKQHRREVRRHDPKAQRNLR